MNRVAASNILSPLPCAQKAEVVTELLSKPGLRIERIVSSGQCSDENFFYDQVEAEWVILLQGNAELDIEIDDAWQRQELQAGDYVNLPSHCRHRIHSTSITPQAVWLDIFYNTCE